MSLFSSDANRCPDFASILKDSSADASLFEQIASCFSERLSGFAQYYCKDKQLGLDAFQEAMIQALTHLDSYRGDSPIEPWLRRIVVSSCSRLRRGKKNDPRLHVPTDNDSSTQTLKDEKTPNQEMALMLAERLELVLDEIEQLKEPDRTLLVRHDVHEDTISTLAAEMNMTNDAIKSRLKRSRAAVRKNLLSRIGGEL